MTSGRTAPNLRLRLAAAHDAARSLQAIWWPGIQPLVISAALSGVLLCAYYVIADEVVEDRRDRFDDAVSRTVGGWEAPFLTWAMRLVTHLGSTAVTNLIYVAMAAWLIGLGRRRAGVLTATVAIGSQVLVQVMKQLSHRARPEVFTPLVDAGGYSFPSGHTFAATVAYGLVAALIAGRLSGRLRLVPWAVWAVIVVVVGFSRVYLGAHYATDTLGSLLLGGAWLVTWLAIMELAERPHRFLPPRRDARSKRTFPGR